MLCAGDGAGGTGAGQQERQERQQQPVVDLHEQMQSMFQRPVTSSSFSRDFPRLALRTRVFVLGELVVDTVTATEGATGVDAAVGGGEANGGKEEEKGDAGQESAGAPAPAAKRRTASEAAADIFGAVMRALDSSELCAEHMERVQEMLRNASDLRAAVEEVVQVLGGEEGSRAVRALKLIHQGVVLSSVACMKESITKDLLTKDVRTPDGWRITLYVDEGSVQLVHHRREQSVDLPSPQAMQEAAATATETPQAAPPPDASEHFEYEYEVRLVFDAELTSVSAARLRITNLTLSETMSPERQQELRLRLVGDLIVA